jgi:hypothetical protein
LCALLLMIGGNSAEKKDVGSTEGVPLCPPHQDKAIRSAKMIEEMIVAGGAENLVAGRLRA